MYYLKEFIGLPLSLVFVTDDIIFFGGGNGRIDDVIVIGWTDSDFRISRALDPMMMMMMMMMIYTVCN